MRFQHNFLREIAIQCTDECYYTKCYRTNYLSVSVRGYISRDTDFSRDIFSLAGGLKEVPKRMKKSCEITLAKYNNRLVSIKL